MKKVKSLLLFCTVLLAVSCNTTKHVPEGEYLLNKVKISSDSKIVSKDEMKSYVRQMPNSEVLGFWKLQLDIYNLSGRDTTKWINRFWKRIGDEPVIYNPQLKKAQRISWKNCFIIADI